jgi:myo-inositol-1(or 4)-monophosphatase
MELQKLTDKVIGLSSEVAAFIRTEARKFTIDHVESKSFNNLVSYVDKTAEQLFVDGLRELLPEAGFIAEEGTGDRVDGLNWIIDPLDGTTNFIYGIPCYCTSVALVDNNELLLGVILEVTRNECFSAYLGGGAHLNGAKIAVSSRGKLKDTLLATGFPYDDFEREKEYLILLNDLMHGTRGIRRLGSAAADLAYVAAGRFDGFYEYGLNPWDVAAGILIVKEAGGAVTDFKGGNEYLFGEEIVATNSVIHDELMKPIRACFQ